MVAGASVAPDPSGSFWPPASKAAGSATPPLLGSTSSSKPPMTATCPARPAATAASTCPASITGRERITNRVDTSARKTTWCGHPSLVAASLRLPRPHQAVLRRNRTRSHMESAAATSPSCAFLTWTFPSMIGFGRGGTESTALTAPPSRQRRNVASDATPRPCRRWRWWPDRDTAAPDSPRRGLLPRRSICVASVWHSRWAPTRGSPARSQARWVASLTKPGGIARIGALAAKNTCRSGVTGRV